MVASTTVPVMISFQQHLGTSVRLSVSWCPGEQSEGGRSGQTPRVTAPPPAGGRGGPLGGRAPLFDR